MTFAPVRDPLVGSANSGQLARSASTRAGGPASSPATTTVRGPSSPLGRAVLATSRGRSCHVEGPNSPLRRSSGADSQEEVVEVAGRRGSSNWTLRCTGPDEEPRGGEGGPSRWRRIPSGSVAADAERSRQGAAEAKMPTWSVVWLALDRKST